MPHAKAHAFVKIKSNDEDEQLKRVSVIKNGINKFAHLHILLQKFTHVTKTHLSNTKRYLKSPFSQCLNVLILKFLVSLSSILKSYLFAVSSAICLVVRLKFFTFE